VDRAYNRDAVDRLDRRWERRSPLWLASLTPESECGGGSSQDDNAAHKSEPALGRRPFSTQDHRHARTLRDDPESTAPTASLPALWDGLACDDRPVRDEGEVRRPPGWTGVLVALGIAAICGIGAVGLDHLNDLNQSNPIEALLGVSIFIGMIAAAVAASHAIQLLRSRSQ
jgi:hypothetical protein